MVPKKSRVPRAGFESRKYRVVRTPYFSIRATGNGSAANRIAVVVGKSVDKLAVRRNFWKRQAKLHLLKAAPAGVDLIMTIYPKIGSLTKEQFAAEVKKMLKQFAIA